MPCHAGRRGCVDNGRRPGPMEPKKRRHTDLEKLGDAAVEADRLALGQLAVLVLGADALVLTCRRQPKGVESGAGSWRWTWTQWCPRATTRHVGK